MKILALALALFAIPLAYASEENGLAWTSAVIQCEMLPEVGAISCEILAPNNLWEQFVIHTFGTTNTLTESELSKLNGFPLYSLQTVHEAGYEELGGYSVSFILKRTFYNSEKVLVTKTIYISANKNGVSISDPITKNE